MRLVYCVPIFAEPMPTLMDSAAIKLDLIERLAKVKDSALIQQISALLKKTYPEVMEDDDDISDEEYAAFEEQLAKRDRGEVKFHSEEESIRMIREGFKE